jgi:hypothetical protein
VVCLKKNTKRSLKSFPKVFMKIASVFTTCSKWQCQWWPFYIIPRCALPCCHDIKICVYHSKI